MNPEAWFSEPGVCGSCVAWRPVDPGPEDTVAIGLCRLRPELRRVPGSLAKCPKYQQRGSFSYRPSLTAPAGGRKKAAKPVVKRVNEDGELVDVTPRSSSASPRREPASRAVERGPAAEIGLGPPPVARYRPFPLEDPPPPSKVDVGIESAPIVKSALSDLIREELPGRPRDMASKYRHGGKVTAIAEDGFTRSVPAYQFFAWLERVARCLDALEGAVESRPALAEEAEELGAQVRRMRGSLTTFNLLFADREDYFTGKP